MRKKKDILRRNKMEMRLYNCSVDFYNNKLADYLSKNKIKEPLTDEEDKSFVEHFLPDIKVFKMVRPKTGKIHLTVYSSNVEALNELEELITKE